MARHDPRRPTNLTILPPSPNSHPPPLSTPTYASSPRRAPLPPSPAHSTHSSSYSSNHNPFSAPWLEERRSSNLDVPRDRDPPPPVPPLPSRSHGGGDRRAGFTVGGPVSPGRGKGASAYDNKLVSSTLSHLPPLPPLSPTPTGLSPSPSCHTLSHVTSSSHLVPPKSTAPYASPRPAFSPLNSSSGLVFLPDGTALPTAEERGQGARVLETLAHSSPSSPWSLLTVHVLPLFAGGPLKTPIEDLKGATTAVTVVLSSVSGSQLCHSHIIATSQRAPPSRILAVLSSDLRDFIASGMLTLKAKFETLEEAKIVGRAAEVWSFFWAQVLPYLEGVFLPFTQVRDLPSAAMTSSSSSFSSPIAVRHLLLSGFLLHIMLPLLPRLIPLVTIPSNAPAPETQRNIPPPTTSDLQRILQMSLVLSTQAKYSSFFPLKESHESDRRDDEVRVNVESLGKAIRWRMAVTAQREEERQAGSLTKQPSVGSAWAPSNRTNLQRVPSLPRGGRHRRQGWRASTLFGQQWGQPADGGAAPTRQNSEVLQAPEQRWGRPYLDEEDEDDVTPNQSMAAPGMGRTLDSSYTSGTNTYTSSGTYTTVGNGTVRGGESLASNAESQRTPQAVDGYGLRRPKRSESSGSSEVTPVQPDIRRQQPPRLGV